MVFAFLANQKTYLQIPPSNVILYRFNKQRCSQLLVITWQFSCKARVGWICHQAKHSCRRNIEYGNIWHTWNRLVLLSWFQHGSIYL